MARALIVGCGCRGQLLGRALQQEGWEARGTTRSPARLDEIGSTGIEAVVADPDRIGSVLEWVHDVAVVVWLLGSAIAEPEVIAAIHGPRLEHLLRKLVDTPVRGLVYEAAGGVPAERLEQGVGIVRTASETWSIPVEVVDASPEDPDAWAGAMKAAALGLA